jgi:hypothetical protein
MCLEVLRDMCHDPPVGRRNLETGKCFLATSCSDDVVKYSDCYSHGTSTPLLCGKNSLLPLGPCITSSKTLLTIVTDKPISSHAYVVTRRSRMTTSYTRQGSLAHAHFHTSFVICLHNNHPIARLFISNRQHSSIFTYCELRISMTLL